MNIKQLIEWLTTQARIAPQYDQRTAYLATIKYIEEQFDD